MDFQKLYARIRNIDQGKKQVTESVIECGDMPGQSMPPAAPPVTMSVNLNAQGIEHIKELLGLMKGADSPLAAGPVGANISPMPMPTPGMPAGAPKMSAEPSMPPTPDISDLDNIIKLAGMPAAKKELGDNQGDDMASDEEQAEPGTGNMMQDIADEIKDMTDEISDEDDEEETEEGAYDASTKPDPKYQDIDYMTKDIAGGLNKQKQMYKHSYKQGDNPMAMESIKDDLVQRYNAIKGK